MATSIEHQTLTELGARWLKRQGFSVVATELACYGNRERPDVLAFRSTCSAVLEVKISRQDFLADLKKPERSEGGLGNYRFYLCPAGLIEIGDLPPRWGLLYCEGKKITSVHARSEISGLGQDTSKTRDHPTGPCSFTRQTCKRSTEPCFR